MLGCVFWLGCVDFCSVVCKWSSVVCSFGKTVLNRCIMRSFVLQVRNGLSVGLIKGFLTNVQWMKKIK